MKDGQFETRIIISKLCKISNSGHKYNMSIILKRKETWKEDSKDVCEYQYLWNDKVIDGSELIKKSIWIRTSLNWAIDTGLMKINMILGTVENRHLHLLILLKYLKFMISHIS